MGVDVTAEDLLQDFDAVCLTGGATKARELPIQGHVTLKASIWPWII